MPFMQNATFAVGARDAKTELLDFLAGRLAISRKKVKRILDARLVFVNGQRVWMARHRLKVGDEVEVHFPRTAAPATAPSLLYDDQDLCVANKPSGILTDGPGSLEAQLRESLGIPELCAVHRLDRDTTGCVVFAKRPAIKDALIQLFKERRVTKVYHAIALGSVRDDIREIKMPIDGEPAITHLTRLSGDRLATHLKLKIDTGRTHQIRKHLAAIGHPVLGDKQYATARLPSPVLRSVARQMLHAESVAFVHPVTGQDLRVKAVMPPDFMACLRRLKLT